MTTFRLLLVTFAAAALALVSSSGSADFPPVLRILNPSTPQADARFGSAVATGDANGDGRADLLVAAPYTDEPSYIEQGRVYLYSGATGALLFTRTSPDAQSAQYFGLSAAMGDANGDGHDDLLIGAPYRTVSQTWQGRAFLFSGADGTLLRTLDDPTPNNSGLFGNSVAMGDADGDGLADLFVGGRSTAAYLFSGADGALLRTFAPPAEANTYFGLSAAMGDVDSDGLADVLIGAAYENTDGNTDQGRVYLYFSGSASIVVLTTPDAQANAVFGWSVAMGDANSDGRADMLVGARGEMVGGNATQGRVYLFSGVGAALLDTFTTPNPAAGAEFGYAVAMGDADGDGRADVLVGAQGEQSTDGRAYLFTRFGSSIVFYSESPTADSRFGRSVAMGEASGDGHADILVGAPYEYVSGNANQGRAYLFSGATGPLLQQLRVLAEDTPQFGVAVAMGDADCDGRDDIVVGAPLEDVDGNVDRGRAYVFSGETGTLLHTLNLPAAQPYARFGSAVATGDADADGCADILVGAPYATVAGNTNQGSVYLFSGATGARLFGLTTDYFQANAYFGSSVAMGDADGDGRADLFVGAPFEDVDGNANQGRVYLFSGAGGTFMRILDKPGAQADANFGSALAMADVDADGRTDLVVGAPGEYVTPNSDQGRAYIFSGYNGTLLRTLNTPNPDAGASFGAALVTADGDGDGRPELLVGAPGEDVGGNARQGRAYLFAGTTGGLLLTLNTPNPRANPEFGTALAMGDADGDGDADLLVGAPYEDVGGNTAQGRAYLLEASSGALIQALDSPNPHAYGWFGRSLAMGDSNGDFAADLLVGAPGEDWRGYPIGHAYLFFADRDADAWPDAQDNCIQTANSSQTNSDTDSLGDACDDNDDGDWLDDSADPCPVDAEDYDGFQDSDGCPDPDNDGDGICDAGQTADSCSGSDTGLYEWKLPLGGTVDCRNVSEDFDAFHDGDGCPEPDNDYDGHPDSGDDCPATDYTAGPDGVADTGDEPLTTNLVPMQTREDYDGVIDYDGCHDSPEDDYDGDGFLDEAEVFIGTNPVDPCGPGAWPPDVAPVPDGNGIVQIDDIVFAASAFGAVVGDARYSPRAEIANQNGVIQIDDIVGFASRFGRTCTP